MFILGAIVFLVVMALLLVAIGRARRQSETTIETGNNATTPIMIGVVITTAIVLLLVGLTFWAQHDLASPDDPARLTVDVVDHQYWWEVYYADASFVTANEIYIPVGEPVNFRLNADDVIYSFWVPELSGKLELVPGRVNEFWIEADEPGAFWLLEIHRPTHSRLVLAMEGGNSRVAFVVLGDYPLRDDNVV